ncbi:electron transport protein SCO1/SenC [Acidomonas methanolica]|uniref:Electron transport transmembrane protein Sco1/SenC/PrrC n=1 Tax=Acidomonas methanolica NBRC 104435 TaxID=1231351 RepID=A0A023D3D3_ACIMT|nr:SCO family protein [Acidomonas methanolica]TCS28272.1 protein SCO1/2 [Acidomonas methanolica]GAJ28594.1 electron transport transmembrane protein Sco1/SenC/PrrC [Acidomonas methanolica NBRC 104435]GBQ49089.1 electron transport protein SCO1/SenC [Acidomonas methanolica]GEK98989.1 hypothetical protein AME01nite_14880 [Acidomonas methanolica NBRC 104435]
MGGVVSAKALRSVGRALAVALLLGGGLWLYAGREGAYSFEGTPVRPHSAPPLDLQDDRGQPFLLSSLRGQAVLVYFGYVHCPDVCPMTLAALRPVFAELGADRGRVKVLFVTLDPQHDDGPALRTFLSHFSPVPIGLTGTQPEIDKVTRDWHVTVMKEPMNGMIDHSSVLTLVGPNGMVHALYGPTQLNNPFGIAQDIRHVLDMGKPGAK